MNAHFEHHRAMLMHVRQTLVQAEHRERMQCLARGLYASEAEALEGFQVEPKVPTDAEVYASLQSNLVWAQRMRETAEKYGDKWGDKVRANWLNEAERIEWNARMALAERETA